MKKKLEFNYMLIFQIKKMRPFRGANWRFKGKGLKVIKV